MIVLKTTVKDLNDIGWELEYPNDTIVIFTVGMYGRVTWATPAEEHFAGDNEGTLYDIIRLIVKGKMIWQ